MQWPRGSRIGAGRRSPASRTVDQKLSRIARLSVAALVLLLVLVASGLVVASVTGVRAGRVHVEESQSWILVEETLQQRLAINGYMEHADGADLSDYVQSHTRS